MHDVAGLHQRRLVLIHEAGPALDQMANRLPGDRFGNADVAIEEEVAQASIYHANFRVRICHLSHLKSSNELGLLISFRQWDPPLQFNNGGMG